MKQGTGLVRVLVVEDNESDRERVARLLSRVSATHYALTFAHGSEQAERELARNAHDACLLDYQLGNATALDVLGSHGRMRFGGPIIVLTGNDSYEIDIAVMKAGATDFVSKDALSTTLLERLLRYAIQQHSDRRQFEYLAEHDQVTGLLNRRAIESRIEARRRDEATTRSPFTLVYADLDGFKSINDSLGHEIGDQALISAARRLAEVCGEDAEIGRVGGDEFMLVLDGVDAEHIDSVAERVLNKFREPFTVCEHQLQVTISLGAARYPEDAADIKTLVTFADAAMYSAKHAGRQSFRWYADMRATGAPSTVSPEPMALGNQLRQALDREELYLVYQPLIDISTGRIIAIEALARWQHPWLGSVSPARFVSLAVNQGFINEFSDWVLNTACRQYMAWRDYRLIDTDIVLAVNMSAELVSDPWLLPSVRRQIQQRRIPNGCLELEFSESSSLLDSEAFDELVRSLRALGVRVSIDDVGRGRSTLASFAERPVDGFKIDLDCLRGVTSNSRDQAMVRAIIALGESLGTRVVAEGVESDVQLKFLEDNRCRFAQGYYYAPGLATPDMTELLADARVH